MEIDLLIDTGRDMIAHEIKATSTYNDSLLKSLRQWSRVSGSDAGVLLYNGQIETSSKNKPRVMNWVNYGLKE